MERFKVEVKIGARLVTLLVTPSPYWRAYAWWCKGLCDVRMGSGPYRRFALWISPLDVPPEQPETLLAGELCGKVDPLRGSFTCEPAKCLGDQSLPETEVP